ncbi:MAG: biopolymer transporter ExbD [Phycisphaeraceae bacterium]|nr:biopolymer transporter ExbD [Phycisphaeraceae bacterium]
MKVRLDRSESTEVQMGPLIDCVFLLLIFFIVIAVTKKSIKELGIELPPPGQAVAEVKPRDRDMVIRVTRDGIVYVGDSQVAQQGFLDAVRRQQQQFPEHRIRFEIDHRAQFMHLYPLMDTLKHYGLNDWSFRVEME